MIKKNDSNIATNNSHHNELSGSAKKSMATRIISAIVMVIIVIPSVFLGDWIYFALMTVLLASACFEILGCAGKRTILIFIIYFIFVALIAYWPMFKGIIMQSATKARVDEYFTGIYLPITIVILGFFFLFWLTVIYKDFSVLDASFLITMAILIGLGFQCLFYLRYYPVIRLGHNGTGLFEFTMGNTIKSSLLIIFVFISTIMTDTGAYFVGVFFGKTKMNERISPKKTWEGFWGGIFISFLASSAVGFTFAFTNHPILDIFDKEHWYNILVLALLTPFFATLGDFVFSAIKRHWGIKDYGKLIPGHGGVLDRLDSIFFASIVASVATFIISNVTDGSFLNILV